MLTLVVFPAAGVALLILLARWLGFDAQPKLASPAQAGAVAQDALISFHPESTALAADARAALVAARDGRIALVRPHGDRWIVRIANGAQVTHTGDMLTIVLDEPMFAPVSLQLGAEAGAWAARVAA